MHPSLFRSTSHNPAILRASISTVSPTFQRAVRQLVNWPGLFPKYPTLMTMQAQSHTHTEYSSCLPIPILANYTTVTHVMSHTPH